LDAVEMALGDLVKSPHLTSAQMAQAQKVVDDVEDTAAELESPEGKALPKEARAAKVSASIKELQDLQTDWTQASTQMVASQKAKLTEELKAKEAELVKDQKMLKVLDLQRGLAEKKLALQKLIAEKKDQAATREAQEKVDKKQEMITNMLNMAKTMQAKTKPADDKVQLLVASLEAHVKDVTASLASMEAAHQDDQAEMADAALSSKRLAQRDGKDEDRLSKVQGVFNMYLKKTRREFAKAKLDLQHEVKELHEAITAIKEGDAAALLKVGTQMQSEMKKPQGLIYLQANSHKFLF